MSTALEGRASSPGVAMADAFVVRKVEVDAEATASGTPDEEKERADAALAEVEESLVELAESKREELGDEADIFLAHADFAGDPEIADMAHERIDDGASAEAAVTAAFDSFRALLEKSADEYMAGRAADIDDVRDQVLAVLAGGGDAQVPTARSVVVAHELTPSQTARLPRELIAGVVCAAGSPTSHAAILSRSLGIPAVMGVTGLLDAVANGTPLAIDGATGEVVIDPDDVEREEFTQRIEREEALAERLAELVDEPGRTADGRHVELAANVNDEGTLEALEGTGAEGSGLVRTELLFLEHDEPPSVEDQLTWYRKVLAAFPGQRVVIRTMDIGADKPVPYIDLDEENPALGVRGLRLALERRELLVDQLTALIRAGRDAGPGAGRLAIMFPMVSRPEELDAALAVVDEVCAAESAERPEMGVMIEVPSAALAARRFAQRVEFLSLGTNDLLQYLFAADRVLAGVAHLPDILDPDVLRLLRDIVDGAHAEDAWVGVCGESAADPVQAAAFVGLGMDELSMTPTGIGRVKDALRRVTSEQLAEAVERALAADGPETARELLTDVVQEATADS